MLNITKLVRDLHDSISEEREKISLKDRSKYQDAVSEPLRETAGALAEKWRQTTVIGAEFPGLVQQQNEQSSLLKDNYVRFQSCKRILIANEFRNKLDGVVQRAYFGDGGIRFYGEILKENTAALDPDSQDVSRMAVMCYNSAIRIMMELQQQMEETCTQLEREIFQSGKILTDSKSMHRAMGYSPCGARLNDLKKQIREGSCRDPETEIRELKKVLDANRAALQKMLRLSDPLPEPAQLKNAALRAELANLLDARKLENLGKPEGQTPAGYASEIRNFVAELDNKLLGRYLLPSETAEGKEEC